MPKKEKPPTKAKANQKLWVVRLRGSRMEPYDPAYVVATDPAVAYWIVRVELDRLGLGTLRERELLSVELVAENDESTECGRRLFLPKKGTTQAWDEDHE